MSSLPFFREKSARLHLVPPTSPARITGPPKESYPLNRFNRIAGKRARGYLDVGRRKRQAHPERHSERSEKLFWPKPKKRELHRTTGVRWGRDPHSADSVRNDKKRV